MCGIFAFLLVRVSINLNFLVKLHIVVKTIVILDQSFQ